MVRWLERMLPATIHPMVVHFPIALLYVTLLAEVVSLTPWDRERVFARAGFWALTLSLFAIVAAGASGVISEHSARFTPQSGALLGAHQRDAVLTGVFALLAWCVRVLSLYPKSPSGGRGGIAGTGRGRPTAFSALLVLAAVVMISITGSLGGTMVYQYGTGTAVQTGLPRHGK